MYVIGVEQVGRIFSFFSNTVEEYEPFINKKTFYWPRSLASKTKYQQQGNINDLQEEIGDTVYIVSGAKIKNIKDPILAEKISASPMVTHLGTITNVLHHPVMGYRYTHGRNPSPSFMLPFEFLEELLTLDMYLGRAFTQENKNELTRAIQLGNIINELLQDNQIEFKRAYFKDSFIYIQNDDSGSLFRLDRHLSNVSSEDAQVSESLTYREMPSKQSIMQIVEKCNEVGLDGYSLIQNLRTWRGTEYVKVKIEQEIFTKIEGRLQEGVSTRLILQEDDSDSLITKIKHKVNIDSRDSKIAEKDGFSLYTPKNQILYGPPGTGKTYSVVKRAIEIVAPSIYTQITSDEKQSPNTSFRDQWMTAYKDYVEKRQIQFCTFHQSYSYEDFVEGLRSDADGVFKPTNGVFLDICKEALESNQIITELYELDEENTNFYKMSLGRKDVDDDIYRFCIDNNVITIGFGANLDFSTCKTNDDIKAFVEQSYKDSDRKETVIQAITYFKHNLKIGDIVFVSHGNSFIRAIGRVTGEYEYDKTTEIRYNHFRTVEWLYQGDLIPVEDVVIGRKFMMRSIYQLDRRNLDLEAIQRLISTVNTIQSDEIKNYVLIIDEINRGNISRIFGELITLIEEDKRLGEENEVSVKLPYSRKTFRVPSNLYLIGTMNTADRSITLMDIALRRRFEFIEMLPDVSLLPENADGINVKKLVDVLNKRIEYLYDRDHTIGHALFLGEGMSGEKLISIMLKKVIPLLQEYFYDDWEKIALVLGGATGSTNNSNYFIKKQTVRPSDIFIGVQNTRLEEQIKYSIVSNPTKQALINVYEGNSGQ